MKARLFIVSGPSGVGKTTICKKVATQLGLYYSISFTTRKKRSGEKEGVDYYFVSETQFKNMIKNGEFLEYAKVHDAYYGTSKKIIAEKLAAGISVIMDLDTQGALNLKQQDPTTVLIFIEPPSMDILKQRIQGRKTDAPEVIEKRLLAARAEMTLKNQYHFILVNESLEQTIYALAAIISASLKG